MTDLNRPSLVYTDRASAREAMAALGDPLDPMPDKWVVHILADDDPRLYERAGQYKPDIEHTPTRRESLHVARNILRERGLQKDCDNLTVMIEEGDEYLAATVEVNSEPGFHCVICGEDDHDALGHPSEPERIGPNPYKPGSPGNPLKPEAEKDDARSGRGRWPFTPNPADQVQGPEILYGVPTQAEFDVARARSGRRGVLVIPESMRGAWETPVIQSTFRERVPSDEPSGVEGGVSAQGSGNRASGLTVSEDGSLLNWRGENYVRQVPSAWKNAADSCDAVLRAVLTALGFEADTDPVLAAQKRMRQLVEARAEHPGFEDDGLESEKWVGERPEMTMAEEPVEQRLRRAFLNGFREGVDRASQIIEDWGRWDA